MDLTGRLAGDKRSVYRLGGKKWRSTQLPHYSHLFVSGEIYYTIYFCIGKLSLAKIRSVQTQYKSAYFFSVYPFKADVFLGRRQLLMTL